MMVKTAKEREILHRTRKEANHFSAKYLNGAAVTTPEKFLAAKETEFCNKHYIAAVSIGQGQIFNTFHDWLNEYYSEDGLFTIEDMCEAYKLALLASSRK
jgi:hypothetical protein